MKFVAPQAKFCAAFPDEHIVCVCICFIQWKKERTTLVFVVLLITSAISVKFQRRKIKYSPCSFTNKNNIYL